MLSEFNVRAEASYIEALDVRPIRKARMLLAIAKRVKAGAQRLSLLSHYHDRMENPAMAYRFREAAKRLCMVHEEVRDRACLALQSSGEPLKYEYTERGNAYPLWKTLGVVRPGEVR